MRKIEWEVRVDTMTFQPVCVCLVEGERTDVRYTIEMVHDLTVQYGRDNYICDVKAVLDEELQRLTNLTAEERLFALSEEGFVVKPIDYDKSLKSTDQE